MIDSLYNVLIVVAIIFALELLDLPDIIKNKISGKKNDKDLEKEVESLKVRVENLEREK